MVNMPPGCLHFCRRWRDSFALRAPLSVVAFVLMGNTCRPSVMPSPAKLFGDTLRVANHLGGKRGISVAQSWRSVRDLSNVIIVVDTD